VAARRDALLARLARAHPLARGRRFVDNFFDSQAFQHGRETSEDGRTHCVVAARLDDHGWVRDATVVIVEAAEIRHEHALASPEGGGVIVQWSGDWCVASWNPIARSASVVDAAIAVHRETGQVRQLPGGSELVVFGEGEKWAWIAGGAGLATPEPALAHLPTGTVLPLTELQLCLVGYRVAPSEGCKTKATE